MNNFVNKYYDLKIKQNFFSAVAMGRKTFEIRLNDRNYQEGDFLKLCETNLNGDFTGRYVIARVIYMFDDIDNEYLLNTL